MSVDLVTKFLPFVDEQFTQASKLSLLTNQDYSWSGARTIKIYKISTSGMNDYDRSGTGTNWSRFGPLAGLDATVESMSVTKDRSFTFAIDRLDSDETAAQLAAASALSRQNAEVVIPETDQYVYGVMAANAGTKPEAIALTDANIYDEVLKANAVLDDALVPETNRVLVVNPSVYVLLKKSASIMMATEIGQDMRLKGVVGMVDGLTVIKVPASRLPAKFGFMLAHPVATVAPVKLQDFRIHQDPPGISGSLIEGRVAYDAHVLDNKKMAIYYQATV